MTVQVKVVDLITARNGIRAAFVALRGGYVLSVQDDADRALAALDIAIGRLGIDPTYSDRSSAGVAARPALARPAWQPIDTAPKDGTTILLGNSNRVESSRWVPQTKVGPVGHWLNEWYRAPTHWQALPPPPEEADAQK